MKKNEKEKPQKKMNKNQKVIHIRGLIGWASNLTDTVVLNVTEGEYIAMGRLACNKTWAINVINQLGGKFFVKPAILDDSQSGITMALTPIMTKFSIHIDRRHHYIRQCNE